MGTQPCPEKGAEPPIFGPFLLWPKGSMDQVATWYGGRPRPKRHCVTGGPSSPLPQKGHSPLIFGPCLLRSNGCIYQDSTWYGGTLQPRRHLKSVFTIYCTVGRLSCGFFSSCTSLVSWSLTSLFSTNMAISETQPYLVQNPLTSVYFSAATRRENCVFTVVKYSFLQVVLATSSRIIIIAACFFQQWTLSVSWF